MPSTLSQDELRALERSLYDGVIKADRGALDLLVHDNVTYMHSTGKIENKKECIDALLKGGITKVDSDEMISKRYPGVGIITCNIVMTSPDRLRKLIQSQVWAEFPEGWRLIHRQTIKAP